MREDGGTRRCQGGPGGEDPGGAGARVVSTLGCEAGAGEQGCHRGDAACARVVHAAFYRAGWGKGTGSEVQECVRGRSGLAPIPSPTCLLSYSYVLPTSTLTRPCFLFFSKRTAGDEDGFWAWT